MPFKDTKEGTTHSYNDGCGEPEHNMPQHPEKEPCDGECNHDFCEGKQPEKEPLEKAIAEVRSVRKERESKEPCEWEKTWESFEEDVREYGYFPSALAEHCKAFFLKCLTSTREEATVLARREISREILPKVQKFIDKVESGHAKSKETYADMLSIRQLLAELSDNIK